MRWMGRGGGGGGWIEILGKLAFVSRTADSATEGKQGMNQHGRRGRGRGIHFPFHPATYHKMHPLYLDGVPL